MEDFSDTNSEASQGAKQSKYNSAIAQLYRMDDLFKDAHTHARNILYASWNEDLDRVWLELAPDAKEEDLEKIELINQQLFKLNLYSNLSKLKKKRPDLHSKLIHFQKGKLMEKEKVLRELLNSQGKGTAYESDFDDYMD